MRFRSVNTFFHDESQPPQDGAIVVGQVSAAPRLIAPAFGKWLAKMNEGRTYEQVAQRVRPLVKDFGMKVNRSLLKKYEDGRIPPWPMIYAFAELHRVRIADITERLYRSIETVDGRDLPCPSIDKGSVPGGADATSSAQRADVQQRAEIAKLAARIAHYEARLAEVRDGARALARLAARRGEGAKAPRRSA